MKAIVYTHYGPPEILEFRDVEKPTPKDDEVLIQVHAASVNALDWHTVTADIPLIRLMNGGLLNPKNIHLGADIAGIVEAVGKNIRWFKPGDEVYGDIHGRGSFAEYAVAPERLLAMKPANLTFAEAAAVPVAGLTALQALRNGGGLQPGQKILIQGASGGVGTFAVQIAKAFGAEVTAVCSTNNVNQTVLLGADHVIDYKKEDFTKNGQRYDLILAVNGYHSLAAYKRALSPCGTYVMIGGTMAQIFQSMLLASMFSEKGGRKMIALSAKVSRDDLHILKKLVESGKVAPVIDKRYPLKQTAEALRYLGQGHAKGKVVIVVR